uniref:hypothetical protein n=1 Tax=Sphaeromyxa zaharoni TaxID=275449 RepID=UPI0030011F8C
MIVLFLVLVYKFLLLTHLTKLFKIVYVISLLLLGGVFALVFNVVYILLNMSKKLINFLVYLIRGTWNFLLRVMWVIWQIVYFCYRRYANEEFKFVLGIFIEKVEGCRGTIYSLLSKKNLHILLTNKCIIILVFIIMSIIIIFIVFN